MTDVVDTSVLDELRASDFAAEFVDLRAVPDDLSPRTVC
jgi:hypothetical protein